MHRLLLALALALPLACGPQGPPPPGKRVIMISLDTLRADHLSLSGYGRETSPNLDRMALTDGVVFERCYAQASWTLPSHMSMFTGLYPDAHGVTNGDVRLAPEVVTLAEGLRSAGLSTAAFTDGGFVATGWGLEDGFEEFYDDPERSAAGGRGFKNKLPHIEDWLRDHRDSSFFLFLHSYDIHAPYVVGEPWLSSFAPDSDPSPEDRQQYDYLRSLGESDFYKLERFEGLEHLVAAYDGMILWTDHVIGRITELLVELEIYDETLIVVTSDHGESFLDRGLYAGHGLFLNEAEIHVPLIIKYPGNRFAGSRSKALVESVDIMPTILSALEIPPPAGQVAQGNDLTGLLVGGVDPTPLAFSSGAHLQGGAVRSEAWTLLMGVPDEVVDRVVIDRLEARDFELARSRASGESRLVPTGPVGSENFMHEQPDVLTELRQALRAWRQAQSALRDEVGSPLERKALSEGQLERLEQLGYL